MHILKTARTEPSPSDLIAYPPAASPLSDPNGGETSAYAVYHSKYNLLCERAHCFVFATLRRNEKKATLLEKTCSLNVNDVRYL
jgi:hypothetical protein